MDISPWLELLRPVIQGRRIIVAAQSAPGSEQTVRTALAFGATDVLVVAARTAPPWPGSAQLGVRVVDCGVEADASALASIRAYQSVMRSPPGHVRAEIDRFDPSGSALVLGDFLNENAALAGRPFVFHRRPEWVALDDKTTVDSLWDAVGVERSPSMVVDATVDAVGAVFARHDLGAGVVIAVDSVDGWTGGGEGTRWLPTVNDIAVGLEPWSPPERRVRVMPFLEGIPCSIHGIVFDDHVIALRPVEMVTLRRANGTFFYAGCASYYDPQPADREAMRSIARRVGAHLRDAVGFRGAFTVDGVMTADGFRPTELNPRNGAGLNTMERAYGAPLHLVIDFVASGMAADWRPRELEVELLRAFDARRGGGTWGTAPLPATEVPETGCVRLSGGVAEPVDEPEAADLVFSASASLKGTFLRGEWRSGRIPTGPSTAPAAAAFWNWADDRYGLGLGAVTAAHHVR